MSDSAKPQRSLWLLVPLVLFLGLSLLFFSRLGHDPNYLPAAMLGQALPEFELEQLSTAQSKTLETQKLTTTKSQLLKRYENQYFLLNVWASWCGACYQEHDFLLVLAVSGVSIVGVNYKDEEPKAQQFLNNLGSPFTQVLLDANGSFGLDLGVYGAPETYLINPDGNMVVRYAGPLTARVWQEQFLPFMQAKHEQTAGE